MDLPKPAGPSPGPHMHLRSASTSDVTSSPAVSVFSKGHSSRSGSSTSSIASSSLSSSSSSSPAPRQSLDTFGSGKRQLEDVREEPQEREHNSRMINADTAYFDEDYEASPLRLAFHLRPLGSPAGVEYDVVKGLGLPQEISASLLPVKKNPSSDLSIGKGSRIGARFPSLSKRWKAESGASPTLSIVTHADYVGSRNSSSSSSQRISPAFSAVSKHDSRLPPSPARTAFGESCEDLSTATLEIDPAGQSPEENQGQATTPLLPPMFKDLTPQDAPLQSPLQSPSIADTPTFSGPTTPLNTPQLYNSLPSPPLSAKPSLTSVRQRSRAGTLTVPPTDIPPLQLLNEEGDEWSHRLGHANFTIEPQPYLPAHHDLDTYAHFRADWDLARRSYARHVARTREHYGPTSTVFLLSEEKWSTVDAEWKRNNAVMTRVVGPILAHQSDGDTDTTDSSTSSALLEKPITRVIVPQIDDPSGKFPKLGDEDIVGPMAVAKPVRQEASDATTQHRPPRKRNFFKFISDVLGKTANSPRS